MNNVDLVVYHYTEIDNVFIPEDIDVRVYLVGDEEGPELHVYLHNLKGANSEHTLRNSHQRR